MDLQYVISQSWPTYLGSTYDYFSDAQLFLHHQDHFPSGVELGHSTTEGIFASKAFNMSVDFPKEEEAVLQRWKEIQAFERQVSNAVHLRYRSMLTDSRSSYPKGASHTRSMMGLHLLPAYLTMDTCWPRQSKT